MSSIQRRGPWTPPRKLEIKVAWGNIELDLREATLLPGTTTFDVSVRMGNLEIIVPPELAVVVEVQSMAGNVEDHRQSGAHPDPEKPLLRIVGSVKAGNCGIHTLRVGETRRELHRRLHA